MAKARRKNGKGGGGAGGGVIFLAVLVVGGYLAYTAWQKRQAEAGGAAGVAADSGALISDDRILFGGEPRGRAGAGTEAEFEKLKNDDYIVGYSESRRDPLWSAYRVIDNPHPFHIPRPKKFEPDTRTTAQVKESDFTRSGYQRGHMTPNEAIMACYGEAAQSQTFLLSNICPQAAELNEHVWERLEADERMYAGTLEEVWVIDGPIFADLNGGTTERLASGIAVPAAFYKILIDGGEHSGRRVRVFAVIMPQDVKGTELPVQYLTSISKIEEETHLEFLWKLDAASRGELESKIWPMW